MPVKHPRQPLVALPCVLESVFNSVGVTRDHSQEYPRRAIRPRSALLSSGLHVACAGFVPPADVLILSMLGNRPCCLWKLL
jgi:hypothetical protein